MLKIRDFWDRNDDELVMNNKLSKQGVITYWRAIDASFRFNVKKREEFVVRNKFHTLKTKSDVKNHGLPKTASREDTSADPKEDEMLDDVRQFFARRQNPYQWRRQHDSNNARFLLPRLKAKYCDM